jgi:cytidylate kinase
MNYCILVTGIPASGKTTIADFIATNLALPVISKDKIKEVMYDDIGFQSREEKIKLGNASMNIMYYLAEQLMKTHNPFILENNFENSSKESLALILEKYAYQAITITLTGDYEIIYQRFLERNNNPDRHRGHVVNECYPEKVQGEIVTPITYESFVNAIVNRGMDKFMVDGTHIILDTTDFETIDKKSLLDKIIRAREEIQND